MLPKELPVAAVTISVAVSSSAMEFSTYPAFQMVTKLRWVAFPPEMEAVVESS